MKSLLLLLMIIPFSLGAQPWGANTESAFVNEAVDVEIDNSGNTYICGYYTGETAFDIGVIEPTAFGNGDIYVAKYSPSGQLLWHKRYGGDFSDRATALALDGNGNIYVTGEYFGTVDFDGNSISSVLNSKDIFLIKMTPQGDCVWAISEGGAGSENAYGLCTDNQNNVILTGQFTGASTIGGQNFTSTLDPVLNIPGADIFISKYTTNGIFQWVETGLAEYEDRGLSVDTDDQDNIFMTGQFSDTMVFAGQTVNNPGYNVGFLAKLSPNGSLTWINRIQAGYVKAVEVEVDTWNNPVIVGDFIGTVQYIQGGNFSTINSTYSHHIFALKTDNNGVFSWSETLGSENGLSANAISIDNNGNCYATGFFKCEWTEMQTVESLFNSVGFKDGYLWKISSAGSTDFVKHFGGKRDDIGHGIATYATGQPLICGAYTEDLNIPKYSGQFYQTSFGHFDLSNGPGLEPDHVFLWGDESRNSFVTSALSNVTPDYNYFLGQPTDSLESFIAPDFDTIYVCVEDTVFYDPQTYPHFGPGYNYDWNLAPDLPYVVIDSTNAGFYTVQVDRWDGCDSGADSAEIIVHQMPLLHDEWGNVYEVDWTDSIYHIFEYCHPELIDLWFTDLCEDCDIQITGPGPTNHSDTLAHSYDTGGEYTVTVTHNGFCTMEAHFWIIYHYTGTWDVDPYLAIVDSADFNDSIIACSDSPVTVQLLDYLENPDTTYHSFPTDAIAAEIWLIQGPGLDSVLEVNPFEIIFTVDSTGWYTFTHLGLFGYDNLCGTNTELFVTVDSFYIEVIQLPETTIYGDNLLCPNGSVYLHIPNTIYDLNWEGPGITWISPSEDSIQVSVAGTYSYEGIQYDTVNYCAVERLFEFELLEKQPPNILTNPIDGIICPYDSLYMYLLDTSFLSYQWFGPTGDSLSQSFDHYDDDQGFYYVNVLDSENCWLTSAPVEIEEYSSPYLSIDPINILCEGDQVTVSAVFGGNGSVNWLPPLSGSASTVIIDQPGWYYAELQHCGITVIDSVQIIDGSFDPPLIVSDTLLCYGEEATASTTGGMNMYEWSTGELGVPTIVFNDSLDTDIYATVTNNYGCIQNTDTVSIDFVESSIPPFIDDLTLCYGDNATIMNNSGQTTNWYNTDTLFVSTGPSINLFNQYNDTTIYAAHLDTVCPTFYDPVNVIVIQPIQPFEIYGDSLLCPEEETTFWVNSTGLNVDWYVGPILVGNGDSILLGSTDFSNSQQLMAILSNSCESLSNFITIDLLLADSIHIQGDSTYLCSYDALNLSIEGNYSVINWNGNFGSHTGTPLNLDAVSDGFIYVEALDSNGCITNSDSIWITNSQLYAEILYLPETECLDDIVLMEVQSNYDSLLWSTPTGPETEEAFHITLNDTTIGSYSVVAMDAEGCVATDSIEITYNVSTPVSFENLTLCEDDYIGAHSPWDSLVYVWDHYGEADSVPIYTDGMYYVSVVNQFHCVYNDSVYVDVVDCEDELPNVITPNGDGINDYFLIDEAVLYPNNRLVVVNRWGNKVFDQAGYLNTFGGEWLNDGVYFYMFYYDTVNDPENVKHGYIHLYSYKQ